jgi:hypothetical protein
MTVPFAQQPRALRSTTRIGPTGKPTPARRCSAARVCALSRATVRIPPPSPPTLRLTSVRVRLPPNRGGIDYKESHARDAEEVRR